MTPASEKAAELEAWTLWSERRPTNTEELYRWRIPARMICNAMLRPEWSSKLVCCGMGYGENEFWPQGSHWNGYVRSVAPGLEWRLAGEGETKTVWHGLDLLPSPFTGVPPRVDAKTRWVAAAPYEVESFSLHSYLVDSYGWTDANKMMAAWNQRVPMPALRSAAALAREKGDG